MDHGKDPYLLLVALTVMLFYRSLSWNQLP